MSRYGSLVRTGLPAGALDWHRTVELTDGWLLAMADPGTWSSPEDLDDGDRFVDAVVPGTVAQVLGPDDLDGHEDYDARDSCYRCTFRTPDFDEGERVRLRFDGLATLAQIWLNGEQILESANMFHCHAVDVTDRIRDENELVIFFRSLGAELATRRPRPRWKTRLVDHQQIRWVRTTLLGRIPGWTPAIRAVGPWRPVFLEIVAGLDLRELDLQARLENGVGVVELEAELTSLTGRRELRGAALMVGEHRFQLPMEQSDERARIHGSVRIPGVERWWPRTHGRPHLHDCSLSIETAEGSVRIDCGRIGFRELSVDASDGQVQFSINGVPVFCRGACWTTNDITSLVGPEEDLRRTLELLSNAHGNMVRVGGTMVYESDAFYRICDELGVMVWQDFMFANMDYPVDDADFRANAEAEVDQQLRRLQRHCSVVAYCGGSEIEQQAAMLGAPRDIWTNVLFRESIPQRVAARTHSTPYWTSTPTGGALPFHVGEGLAHYFGVGAYKRPLDDVRLAGVRFTPECLGFSNVPEPPNLRHLTGTWSKPLPHHPAWKEAVPRDSGAGWDFDDIRDHYLRLLWGVDPVEVRSQDFERYMRLSRVVTGRVMASAFDEWRSSESRCGGALVWFLKDIRPGAGWGIIDSENRPKAAYYYLKRAWAPTRIRLLDRGLDGIRVEVDNETAETLTGVVEVSSIDRRSVLTAKAARQVSVPPRGQVALAADDLLGCFMDLTYSYRFGPRVHAAVSATLSPTQDDGPLERVVLWSEATPEAVGVTAEVEEVGDGGVHLVLSTSGAARDVRLDLGDGAILEDNYVDLWPDEEVELFAHRRGSPGRLRGYVEANGLEVALPAADHG